MPVAVALRRGQMAVQRPRVTRTSRVHVVAMGPDGTPPSRPGGGAMRDPFSSQDESMSGPSSQLPSGGRPSGGGFRNMNGTELQGSPVVPTSSPLPSAARPSGSGFRTPDALGIGGGNDDGKGSRGGGGGGGGEGANEGGFNFGAMAMWVMYGGLVGLAASVFNMVTKKPEPVVAPVPSCCSGKATKKGKANVKGKAAEKH